jgi:hypothetical protein
VNIPKEGDGLAAKISFRLREGAKWSVPCPACYAQEHVPEHQHAPVKG